MAAVKERRSETGRMKWSGLIPQKFLIEKKTKLPMRLKHSCRRLLLLFIVCLTLALVSPYASPIELTPVLAEQPPAAGAQAGMAARPGYSTVRQHRPGLARTVTGTARLAKWIDVPDVFSLAVVQQPAGDLVYVSIRRDLVTQFHMASQNGVTGLLAHDFLSGKEFYKLSVGQIINVTYTDDSVRQYQVSSIRSYQKLDPESLHSDYIDLSTQEELSTGQVFDRYYMGKHHLILQTCLPGEGRLDWGLYFVVASPVEN